MAQARDAPRLRCAGGIAARAESLGLGGGCVGRGPVSRGWLPFNCPHHVRCLLMTVAPNSGVFHAARSSSRADQSIALILLMYLRVQPNRRARSPLSRVDAATQRFHRGSAIDSGSWPATCG